MTEADNNTTGFTRAAEILRMAAAFVEHEAEIVRLAAAVVETEAAYVASFEPPATSCDEEQAREPVQAAISDARNVHLDRLAALPAVTLAGITAKARAAYAMAEKHPGNGAIRVNGISDILAFGVVEDLLAYGSTAAGEASA